MIESKLSLVAQYDDLIRYCESLIGGDLIEEKIKSLLENCEKQRVLWLTKRNEANEAHEQIKQLKKENKCLETTLKNVRVAFRSEVNLKEKLKHERDSLLNKLTLIQTFLLEDAKENQSEVREKILSSLNMSKFQPVNEMTVSDDSFPDIEFDKTDDDLMNTQPQLHSTRNRLSTGLNSSGNNLNLDEFECKRIENERRLSKEFEQEIQMEREKNSSFRKRKSSIHNDYPSSPSKKTQQTDDLLRIDDKKTDRLTESYDTLEELEKEDQFDEKKLGDKINSLGQFKSGTSINSKMNQLTQSLVKQRLSIPALNESKIDNRPHQFVTKKVFRPEKCGPCGLSIGFCTTAYNCRDCRAICHMTCKDKVPLPCIPYVSRANIGKQGKLVLISDFTPQNVRPCVPALIIHCCTEIERRGLEEVGLYRVSGSRKDVTDYKERILDSKKGMPNLTTVDIYSLCGVVKEFLNSLDESLITKLAWRDFVTGTAIQDEEQRAIYLRDLISNLHVANRDTLAYIILHLKKIAASPNCKMPIYNLAKVFGPTIVGFSMKDPPAEQMREENAKQIAVMDALLSLDTEFWESTLSQKSNVPLIRKDSLNEMIGNLNQGSSSANKLDGYKSYSNSRMSIGSRLYGGRVASGTLTPLKSSNLRSNSSKANNFKPLF